MLELGSKLGLELWLGSGSGLKCAKRRRSKMTPVQKRRSAKVTLRAKVTPC